MKAVSIVIKDNEVSELGYSKLVESSKAVGNDFEIAKYDAVVPTDVDGVMTALGLKWNYPWEGEVVDYATGLVKTAYKTANPKARMACACSHYYWWNHSYYTDSTILILEHDANFINKIDFDPADVKADIIGINNPLGATRKSQLFYDKVIQSTIHYPLTPMVDNVYIPQGLAGNSAYIVKPEGAKQMLELVKQYGLWPNDAIMCRQLIPKLSVSRKFYTNIQGLKSTTSL